MGAVDPYPRLDQYGTIFRITTDGLLTRLLRCEGTNGNHLAGNGFNLCRNRRGAVLPGGVAALTVTRLLSGTRAAIVARMSKQYAQIDGDLAAWISRQRLFFVATAPLSADGHVNTSPKGGEALRVLGPREVAYQDYTGSGAETVAHLRENGRIVIMFCAFDGPPKIVRLHGRGTVVTSEHPRFGYVASCFPVHPGTRAFIHVDVTRVSDSCGHGVPCFDYRGERDALERWATLQGPENLKAYRAAKNATSIDGLAAFGHSGG